MRKLIVHEFVVTKLQLQSTTPYPTGVVGLHYAR